MWKNRPKLNEVYAAWSVEHGFFMNLCGYLTDNNIDYPEWLKDTDTAQILDFAYHGNHSGNKFITNFISRFITDGYITDSSLKKISGIWFAINKANCERMWNSYKAEYNPIENYSMTENSENTKTGTDTYTLSGKETETSTGTQKVEGESSATGNVFGYNSGNNGVPADSSSGETESTRTDDLTHEKSFTNRQNETEYNTTDSIETTRSGNIGVTTSQQMLQSEIDLWQWNFYKDFLFRAVDTLLTLSIY